MRWIHSEKEVLSVVENLFLPWHVNPELILSANGRGNRRKVKSYRITG